MKVVERGWPAHFCCAYDCLFRRNTLISHKGKSVIVSTVGMFLPDNKQKPTVLGSSENSYYETYIFGTYLSELGYVEADVGNHIDSWYHCYPLETDQLSNIINDAHDQTVKEYKNKLKEKTS